MDEADITIVVARQKIIADELAKLKVNIGKDSASRKTAQYKEDRIKRVEQYWNRFQENHKQIEGSLKHDTPYVAGKTYQKVQVLYNDLMATLRGINPVDVEEGDTEKEGEADKSANKDDQELAKTKPIPTSRSSLLQIETSVPIIRRQYAAIAGLQRALEGASTQMANRSSEFYKIKIKNIERYWEEVLHIHNLVHEQYENPSLEGYNVQDFIKIEEHTEEKLIELNELANQGQQGTTGHSSNSSSNLKLPKISLQKFDGDYLKWRQFHDLFVQIVHNQPMAKCQKLWYLKTNLSGEAERLIRHFTTSDNNYDAAWKTIVDRYDNTRLLVSALINKLMNQPNGSSDRGTSSSVKAIHDTTQECLMGLTNIGISIDNWDPLITHIVLKKLDRDTHTLYEQSLENPRTVQKINDLLEFLERRFQSLEALGSKGKFPEEQRRVHLMKKVAAASAPTTSSCISCNGTHPLYACHEFLRMTPGHRLNLLKKHQKCVNCFMTGHQASKCKRRGCTKCFKKHNTLVHLDTMKPIEHNKTSVSKLQQTPDQGRDQTLTVSAASQQNPEQGRDQTLALSAVSQHSKTYILLGTARISLESKNGEFIECRALLDSGSQVNFITEKLVGRLGLSAKHDTMQIQGIGHATQNSYKRVNIHLQSRINGFSTRIEAMVLPKILSQQPTQFINIKQWNVPKNIQLADPKFNCPGNIDLLIGAELYHELLSVGQIKSDEEMPTLQNTVFGWIATGRVGHHPRSALTCGMCIEDENLNALIEKFWSIEDPEDTRRSITSAEKWCETHFTQTTHRDENGRFIVRLPFQDDPSSLGESKNIALRRLYSLERRLANNSELKKQYHQFMDEYISLGHMQEVAAPPSESPHYFLPHHCVQKPDSSTTKLRVVFDASSKTSSNISLNDILHTGPKIQDDLFTILLRFRLPRFVFTADIQKMYRQVLVHEEDRKYQLILWRRSTSEPIKCYQLNTLTYGTSAAPYLAIKSLQHLSQSSIMSHPIGSKVLQHDFYVDDVMTGSNSLSTTLEMQGQLIDVLQTAGFKLRKWCANHPRLLQAFLPEDKEMELDFSLDSEDNIKTLGLTWLPKVDDFCIKSHGITETKITKRIVSSEIARLFDPLGFLAPIVITAKIFLQQLWQLKIDWDAALPQDLHSKWMKFRDDFKLINQIRIPRHIFSQKIPDKIQLHIFADASESAYGACIYVRSKVNPGTIIVRLLCAKSRVAPIEKKTVKKPTIPRLELCAAKLAADLAKRVKKDIEYEKVATYFWTDSEIVLAWINSTSKTLPIFIANRVSSIQASTISQQWRHVRSKENPADLLTRGISPEKLKESNLWFYGPIFLHGQESAWPQPYAKPVTSAIMNDNRDSIHFIYKIQHGNSFKRLQRVTAFVLRYIQYLKVEVERKKQEKLHSNLSNQNEKKRLEKVLSTEEVNKKIQEVVLSSQELTHALNTIVQVMQRDEFSADILQLNKYHECSKTSAILCLSPFLDENKIIRVGGRLESSTLPYEAKHPILLPYEHPFVKMIMKDIHEDHKHVGPQALLAITRQRFWPIKGKIIARAVVKGCIRCTRAKPELLSPKMGNLPTTRVEPARPFVNSGVDFCGPIWIHYRGRGSRPQKGYIAVFCCFATKAVHLEVVSALTTEAFIGALKRFTGRRGHVRNLYCDNATNFVGARNQLQELSQSLYSSEGSNSIISSCTTKGIDFHFIPPRSPHFGGLWEAAVKSAKHLLYRSTTTASLTYEEFETLIIEIEAILNSRPLTPLSSDPNDLTALTPGHFLIGEPLTASIDSNVETRRMSLPTRWKLVTYIKNEFWKRWSREYLNELQQRSKWKQDKQNLQPGAIVLIKEDNIPPLKWPLGRVVKTYPGEDGVARVADVKTATNILRRAIHKLAPLPIDDDDDKPKQECPYKQKPEDLSRKPNGSSKRKAEDYTSMVTKASTSNSEHDQPQRKHRRSFSSAVATVLLVCLALPIISSHPVEINQFPAQLGLHFESLGIVNLASNDWNLVVYYDLEPYWAENAEFTNGILSLRQLCKLISHNSSCISIINQFVQLQEELKRGNELFTNNNHKPREKRGAFNIVGTLANSLFGVLDADYAQELSKTISDIKGNEDYVLQLLKNHTSIIDSTVNIIKGDQVSIREKFRTLKEQVNKIIDHTNQENLHNLFLALSIELTLIITNTQRIQASLINVLIDTNHGKINPLLLSPQQLNKEILIIRGHIPSSLRLPVESSELLQLYKLMTLKSRIINNHVMFQIKFPLVIIETFDIFRVIPIPIFTNGSFTAIKPDTPYLIVSQHRDQYYPLLDQELATCLTTGPSTYLCEQTKPLYRKGSSVCICEVSLLNNMPLPSKCKLTQLIKNQIWTRLTHPNEWIYAIKNKTIINAVCGSVISSICLEGSGLLKIQPNCVIKQDELTFQGHKIYTSNTKISYTKLSNLSSTAVANDLVPAEPSFKFETEKIEELSRRIKNQILTESSHKLSNHDIHQYSVGYLALILLVSFIIIWCWRTRASIDRMDLRRTPRQSPIPRIRTKLSLPAEQA